MAQTAFTAARPLPHVMTHDQPAFSVPARHNPRLQALVDALKADEELRTLWRCANTNAVDRLGQGDSGEVHARIVANAGLKLLRLLREAGVAPGVTEHHRLPPDEAEVVVVLAAALHGLGLAAGVETDLALASLKGRELLAGLYPVRERTILLAETLHAMAALPAAARCLTLEASVLKLADVLDMTKGRVRLPPAAPPTAARPEPALWVDEVLIQKHRYPPVRVLIALSRPEGAAQVTTLLRSQVQHALLAGRVEIAARLGAGPEAAIEPLSVWME